jgi:two-component system cell cycle sensor histidine kinase/response regulator CckA
MWFLTNLLDTTDFPARWHCGSWSDIHGWVHIVADTAIFAAYFAIPCLLAYFLIRRRDVPFLPVFWLFAAFILSCGIGHAIEASIFWHPWYRLSALIKVCTALVSWATVVALVPLLPKALSLPGLALINARLNREIHRRERSERYRIELDRKMQQAQKLESLGVLAGGIAHDFNNLLTAILGFAELAEEELTADAPAREHVSQVIAGAKQAAQLTRQMLAYSGRGRFVIEPVDLPALVDSIRELLQVSISKNCVVRLHADPHTRLIEADVSQLQQVIMNLMINASEAIGDSTGTIALTVGEMECDRSYLAASTLGDKLPPGRYVFLEVTDDGTGMSGETIAKMFDPFFTTKFSGRGLGLAATLGIVRAHRGAIRVNSQIGEGTAIRLLFPIPSRPLERQALASAGKSLPPGGGTILVVDDEEPLRHLAARMLKKLGYDVQTAARGSEAIALYQKNPQLYQFVLLDLTMPEMNGIEVIRALRELNPNAKVVLMSGYSEQEMLTRAHEERPSAFLSKPFRLVELRAAIEKTTSILDQR